MTLPVRIRRASVAVFAIVLAGALLRTQLSSALVTRGDSLAYWGHRTGAQRMYARALFFDSRNGVAADRYGFVAAESGDPAALEACIVVTSRYLSKSARDAAVLLDRALCYQHRGLLSSAIADFRRAGVLGRDARAFMFAALDERALHHANDAQQLLRKAVASNPNFLPARLALARI